MWKSKKFILIAVLVALIVVGSTAAVVYAETGSTGNTTAVKTLQARVATILGIDQQKVENAFTQAQRDMQNEALDNYLKNLVDKGKITQQQADQYKQWWKSRPNLPNGLGLPDGFGFRGRGGFPRLPGPPPPPATTTPSS